MMLALEGEMNRLQEFAEQGAFGEGPGRTAYVLDPSKLPAPNDGFKWRVVDDFRPGDAVLNDPGLRPVFERALKQGCELVTRQE
jgi:hypothetical protein